MCGRSKLIAPFREIAALYRCEPTDLAPEPRYNIAPTQLQAVVRQGESGRHLARLRWGLVPAWAESTKIGARMINARAEDVEKKPAFARAFKKRRCLVVIDGFYEWRTVGGAKAPFLFHMPAHKPFALAGLWENWTSPDGELVETCAVLTTDAKGPVAQFHTRMPVVLADADVDAWLDPNATEASALKPLLASTPSADLIAQAVSTLVNSPRNDGPECLVPP